MTTDQVAAASEIAEPPTDDQLHGKACIHCGDTVGPLAPAGHRHTVTQPGRAPLGWAVVACPAHAPKEHTR
jgi:hypothetical protein